MQALRQALISSESALKSDSKGKIMTFISKTAMAVMAACQAIAGKREVQLIDSKINQLIEKKAELTGKAIVKADKQSNAKGKSNCTCAKDDLIIDVAANVQVKDVCRNIERKLQRNLSSKSESDKQLLYNHLYYFYSLKHINTLPEVIGKNKTYHIADYVAQRTNNVINDTTCHINFK